jgi:hypothetical protein
MEQIAGRSSHGDVPIIPLDFCRLPDKSKPEECPAKTLEEVELKSIEA